MRVAISHDKAVVTGAVLDKRGFKVVCACSDYAVARGGESVVSAWGGAESLADFCGYGVVSTDVEVIDATGSYGFCFYQFLEDGDNELGLGGEDGGVECFASLVQIIEGEVAASDIKDEVVVDVPHGGFEVFEH